MKRKRVSLGTIKSKCYYLRDRKGIRKAIISQFSKAFVGFCLYNHKMKSNCKQSNKSTQIYYSLMKLLQ